MTELEEMYKAEEIDDRQKHDEKVKEIEERYNKQKEINKELVEENESLKTQIEKMKCCSNCRHSRTEYEHCRTDKHEKWEIKEND